MDVNLVIAVLGGLWLSFMVVALARSIRAKQHKNTLLFAFPLALIAAVVLLWNS